MSAIQVPSFTGVISKLALVVAAALLTTACATQPAATAATAEVASQQPAAATPAAAVASNEPSVICRSEQVTGTNFREKVCLTAEGWKKRNATWRSTVQEFSRQTNENSAINGNGAPGGAVPR